MWHLSGRIQIQPRLKLGQLAHVEPVNIFGDCRGVIKLPSVFGMTLNELFDAFKVGVPFISACVNLSKIPSRGILRRARSAQHAVQYNQRSPCFKCWFMRVIACLLTM